MGCTLSSGDIVGEGIRVRIIRQIAKGGYGEVFYCEDIDSADKYAVKQIKSTCQLDVDRIQNEADVHRLLTDVPTAVQLIALIHHDGMPDYYLVFPFYSKSTIGEELTKRRQNNQYFPEERVLAYFEQICMCIEKMHVKGYAHRDLKPANFLISDNGEAHVTDFGSSAKVPITIEDSRQRQLNVDEANELCSMPYRAPELFNCDIGTCIDTSIDIWSLGCCLYAFCYFVSPFDLVYEKGNSIALAAQSPHTINYPQDAPYSEELVDFIKSILKSQPSERPTIDDLIQETRRLGKRCQNESNTVMA